MTQEQLEQIYASLAQKIDVLGPDNTEIFLAKLTLLIAQNWGDAEGVERCIVEAAQSLETSG